MAKKSGNLLALVTGVVAGAAAVFFSKQENRTQATKVAKKATTRAKKIATEYEANPKAFKNKIKSQAKKAVKKAVAQKTKIAPKKKTSKPATKKKTTKKK